MSAQSHVQRTSRTQFGMVDARIIRDPSLPPSVKNVYTYLATFCGNAREAFPSRARIAREIGISVRTVDTANKIAKECGLFTIARKAPEPGQPAYAEHHQPNIYLLHDFDGGYEVGSGPLAQPLHQGEAQPVQGAGATVAHYQDHSSEPSTSQRPTSTPPGGDDCASSGSKRVLTERKLKLIKPKGYAALEYDTIAGALPKTFIGALEPFGFHPTERAKSQIGKWVHREFANGRSRQQLWVGFVKIVEKAWRGEEYQWLLDEQRAA